MLRYAWFLATGKRDATMREEALDKLVAEARAFHESVRRDASD